MRFSDIVRRSGRNLRQAKARTILTALAIGVGAFALTLTLAASNGAQSFVNRIIADNFDPSELIVTVDEAALGRGDTSKPQEYDENYGSVATESGASVQVKQLDDKDVEKLRSYKEVEQVREGILVNLAYISHGDSKKYVTNAADFNPAQNPELAAGKIAKPLQDGTILLPEAFVEPLKFKSAEDAVGKTVNIAVRKSVNVQSALNSGSIANAQDAEQLAKDNLVVKQYKVGAVLKKPTTAQPGTELYIYMNNNDSNELNDTITKGTPSYHRYTYVYAKVKDGDNSQKLKDFQAKLKEDGFVSQSVEETQKFLTQIIDVLKGIVAAFGLIAVVASIFGVVNTMYISVLQRTREIGLMKALGIRRRDVSRLFRLEAAWIGFIGGALGSLLAFGLGTALNPWITKTLELGDQKLLMFSFPQIAVLILLLVLVATLAGVLPARKASKLDPIEALRTE